MFNILLLGLVCFFVSFGIVDFFRVISEGFFKSEEEVLTVVPLHNNGDNAEKIIRNILKYRDNATVIAVDYNSSDETIEVLRALENQYCDLYVLTIDEFVNYMKDKYDGDEF